MKEMKEKIESKNEADLLKDLRNSDEYLKEKAPGIIAERKRLGLEGLVGGLQAVIINTEPERQRATAEELLRYTGLEFNGAFQDDEYRTCVLKTPGYHEFRSADFLIRSRIKGGNPFYQLNAAPKSGHLPNTRLETFVFETKDIEEYVSIQKSQGFQFLTDDIVRMDNYSFIQTVPSRFTGNSLGFIQWAGEKGRYETSGSRTLDWDMKKPKLDHLKNVSWLDHAATRVKAQDRNQGIIEFMKLTNYNFDFAIYVKPQNSITSVARLSPKDFAMVFTSGISPYISDEISGPTEKFIHNYGSRVHHIAFQTEEIEDTYDSLVRDEMKFLIELVGSPEEGLKQTFTEPSGYRKTVKRFEQNLGGVARFCIKELIKHLGL
jgi:rhodanese-related sulfurtransferase